MGPYDKHLSSLSCGCDPGIDHLCIVHLMKAMNPPAPVRTFDTGATRDTDTTKPDYEGFLSPLVIERYGVYMNKNRLQKDGTTRDSDNWQKGIPIAVYVKSLFRHFVEVWTLHRTNRAVDSAPAEEALCAVMFNAMGMLHEILKLREPK